MYEVRIWEIFEQWNVLLGTQFLFFFHILLRQDLILSSTLAWDMKSRPVSKS